MMSFARTIDAAKTYAVSSTLDEVDWNAELVRGDMGEAVQRLKLVSRLEFASGAVASARDARMRRPPTGRTGTLADGRLRRIGCPIPASPRIDRPLP